MAMPNRDKDILTTAETAKLFGVSVRTAQLMIEGGSIPSWKTPGGHRRVYRTDVEALIAGSGMDAHLPSALVVVSASADRLPVYERLFSAMPECTLQAFDDPHAAAFAIGSTRPFGVVVDLQAADPSRHALLSSLVDNPALGDTLILAVGAPAPNGGNRISHVETPDAAAAALRKAFAGTGETAGSPADATFPIARNERQRLAAVEQSGLMDTAPEEAFDQLAWLAAHTLDAPVALVTLLAQTRQWFKSRIGLDLAETPRDWSFCNHTILQKGIFAVGDLASDPRFEANPAVIAPPNFRFYAGAPIRDGNGFALGSLCVIDYKPRVLEDSQEKSLLALAGLASDEFRLRSTERQLREARRRAEPQDPQARS
ncbi:GAF domain-containing protein [Aurantimonas sp. 22II-16-19i]|uniref:GAF domain-containing protein n=1 Tax=Aurantimonas sp. 22II-16-19i TaxID=1317114 RepID=UPI0009F7BEDE|nr:GAF domain-containing protein [Aurantimonas sp. 22II-16-19i]ORE90347.1 GAF sensor protein [Aurantimonas sp. 22II-16-19i]